MSLATTLAARLGRPADNRPAPEVMAGDWSFGGDRPAELRLTPAAVLIPVIDRVEPTLLLTRRLDTLRRHAGQVAFPGGRIDPEDADATAAALREAHEEVALPPGRVTVVGPVDAWETGTGYHITPVLGVIPPDLPLVPAADEVAALFEVPLAHALDPANHQLREAEWRGRARRFYVIEWETHSIWGATAGIIVNLSRRLGYS